MYVYKNVRIKMYKYYYKNRILNYNIDNYFFYDK